LECIVVVALQHGNEIPTIPADKPVIPINTNTY
jgi:hypothetical protein